MTTYYDLEPVEWQHPLGGRLRRVLFARDDTTNSVDIIVSQIVGGSASTAVTGTLAVGVSHLEATCDVAVPRGQALSVSATRSDRLSVQLIFDP